MDSIQGKKKNLNGPSKLFNYLENNYKRII